MGSIPISPIVEVFVNLANLVNSMVAVAQLVRALGCDPRGWRFDSARLPFGQVSTVVGSTLMGA